MLYAMIRKHEIRGEVAQVARAPIATEHQEQRAVVDWWAYQAARHGLPVFALFAVPNGGLRHFATAAQLKAEGVRPGVPDLVLAVARGPAHGLYVEMKSLSKSARVAPSQQEFQDYLNAAGYLARTCRGATEAIATITAYLKG